MIATRSIVLAGLTAVALAVAGFASGGADAQRVSASTGGRASATVIRPAVIQAITELTVTSSVIIPSVPPAIPADAVTQASGSISTDLGLQSGGEADNPFQDQALLGRPASFAVAGEPNQAFSITLPDRGMILTESSVIIISGFDHNGGLSPSVAGSGAGVFNVQANFDIGDLNESNPELDDIDDIGGTDEGQPDITEATPTPTNQPTNVSLADEGGDNSGDPALAANFSFAVATEPPHFDIVVSYN